MFEKERVVVELELGVNLVRDSGNYKLTSNPKDRLCLLDGDSIEIIILSKHWFSVECYDYPIRMGHFFGNIIIFCAAQEPIHINPKFVFDDKKRHWVLIHYGDVVFAEQEINYPKEKI